MNPLARYYGTLALCVAGFVAMIVYADAGRVDGRVLTGLFCALFALFVYNTFGIGCPKCRKRLGLMMNWGGLRHGLPGRNCSRCHADLTVRNVD